MMVDLPGRPDRADDLGVFRHRQLYVGLRLSPHRLHLAHSREVIERDFAKIPDAVTHKIVFENVARVYQMEL